MKSLSVLTSLAAAIGITALLKFLHLFSFVKWNPVGFSKSFEMFEDTNVYLRWLVLFLVIWVISIVIYYISLLTSKVPVAISSLIFGILLAFVVEWLISDAGTMLKTMKKLSIPFICIVVIGMRFLMESAIFHSKDQPIAK
ncbi:MULTISPECIES: DNA helicase [unclassified Psychrobacillus]|uniref:DNA helicase n=1 Tax=unclassified Psychrobacillus TaxID=2636677 RepID=UPI00146CCDD2|nr:MULTISPECIES: DNA helicase [unclassified Psychrobacillus]MCM3359887.1 DNA helicase [Psychrobacillus sp. MER TA 171]NME04366.1 DNA helicase [Psychrobacillus sp. BL-248-WT-3]